MQAIFMKQAAKRSLSAGVLASMLFTSALSLGAPSVTLAAVADWQKGVTIIPHGTEDFASESFKQSIQEAKAAGANYAALVVPYYQSNDYSTDVARGWNTPSDSSLAAGIDYIHAQGMHVLLKMHDDTYSGDWRAFINPGDRDGWFRSYGNALAN